MTIERFSHEKHIGSTLSGQIRQDKYALDAVSAVLPAGTLSGTARIELSGNPRAVVEGCKGILEYEDDVIRLNTASGIIRFMGQNLGMNCLNEDSAVVEGKILSVEFMS